MLDIDVISSGVICRDEFLYSSHPHVAITRAGVLLTVFNQTQRRPYILHPPHDPLYRNVLVRSHNFGQSWSQPETVPGYQFHGAECASLTVLRNGSVLLNQWTFRWYPLGLARRHPAPEPELQFPKDFLRELIESGELPTGGQIAHAPDRLLPWARGHGECWVHSSDNDGLSFARSAKVNTEPFHGGYGMRGGLELPDDTILLVLNDIPEYRTIYTVRSNDGGLHWREPMLVAQETGHLFTEAALALADNGDVIALMRDDATRILHSCHSEDAGRTWSKPIATGIDGYPPHLLSLNDGRLLCTYGRREQDYGIRAVLSEDGGRSWDIANTRCIREHLPNKDLGYPATVELPDHSLFTVYYCQDECGITGIEFTQWRV